MKRISTLLAILFVAMALSIPAFAYQCNWSDGFEGYTVGVPPPAPWVAPTGIPAAQRGIVQNNPAYVYQGEQSWEQYQGNLKNGDAQDLRYLNTAGSPYFRGWAKFYMYDQMAGDPATPTAIKQDLRAGVHSSAGNDNIGKMFTANITDSRSLNWWYAQWSYSPVPIDGSDPAPATGYNFDPGPAGGAPRMAGWNYAIIKWSFDYSVNTGHVEWYINQTAMGPNLILDFNSGTTRWANSKDVAGVFLGSLYGNTVRGWIDNCEFHAEAVPEPASFLVLGTGLLGMLGVIRRRR